MRSQISPTVSSFLRGKRQPTSLLRDKWTSKVEFLLAIVGYAVDLGNIWRFPYICYKYGGGIGYAICFICTFIACFYNAIIAHALYFLFNSLQPEVPWKTCTNPWNTPLCTISLNVSFRSNQSNNLDEKLRTPSEEFFLFNVLEANHSSGFDDLGDIKPSLALCLTIVFILVYFALWKGPKSTGKFVWITATAPYVILSVLFIRGITLPGASIGIYYYLTPNFAMLLDIDVWTAAATQIFFSLGPGFGVLLALSSYNDFQNNCYRDALLTSIINCATSIFAGFVIFSTLGYMSALTNLPVSQVVGDNDANLIFIVYPQAIATMSYANCWSFIFFIMLIALGIDSTFSGIEALITGFCDEYPRILARKRKIFVGIVIVAYYFGSLPTVTYGGKYVIPFLDEYGVSLSVLFIVMCEMIAVCWFYGVRRFSDDIHQMLGFYPGLYWRFCWICCPVFMMVIFLLTIYKTSLKPMIIGSYTYPEWSVYLGWFLRLTSVLSIPIFAIYYLCNAKGTLKERWNFAIKPQQNIISRRTSVAPSILLHDEPAISAINNQPDNEEIVAITNSTIHL
uniref:Transporter n=1 Tax=Setaria digitata TaxID=48799 RepID=A0A915PEK2_9BILA